MQDKIAIILWCEGKKFRGFMSNKYFFHINFDFKTLDKYLNEKCLKKFC